MNDVGPAYLPTQSTLRTQIEGNVVAHESLIPSIYIEDTLWQQFREWTKKMHNKDAPRFTPLFRVDNALVMLTRYGRSVGYDVGLENAIIYLHSKCVEALRKLCNLQLIDLPTSHQKLELELRLTLHFHRDSPLRLRDSASGRIGGQHWRLTDWKTSETGVGLRITSANGVSLQVHLQHQEICDGTSTFLVFPALERPRISLERRIGPSHSTSKRSQPDRSRNVQRNGIRKTQTKKVQQVRRAFNEMLKNMLTLSQLYDGRGSVQAGGTLEGSAASCTIHQAALLLFGMKGGRSGEVETDCERCAHSSRMSQEDLVVGLDG